MNQIEAKSAVNLVLRAFASVVTAGSGIFLLVHDWQFSKPTTFAIGLCSAFLGVIFAGSLAKNYKLIFGLILFGAYMMARALGYIEHPIARYLVGIPLLFLGLLSIYKLIIDKD